MGSGENLPIIVSPNPNFELKLMENYFPSNPIPKEPTSASNQPPSFLELKVMDDYFSSNLVSEAPELANNHPPSFEEIQEEINTPLSRLPQNRIQPKKPSKLARLSKKILPWFQKMGNKLLNLLRHYASWVSFLQTLTSALLERIPALVLRITDFISPVGRIINGLKLLHNTIFHRKGDWTRRFSLVAGFGSIGLGIAAILLPPFGLIFATVNIANNTFLSLWAVAVSIKNKLALRNTWKDYNLCLLSALPVTGPLRNTLYLGCKNNDILIYRVSPMDSDSLISKQELIKNLGQERTQALFEALKKSNLDTSLDPLYPFQKEILKLTSKKRTTPRKNIRCQIEEDEKEFYSELSDSNKLEQYVKFKNKEPEAYQNDNNIQLSELEARILQRKNQERKLNAQLAIQVYNAGIMFLALAGIVMSFFPPTIIAGASILIATSIHGILFGYDLSGKWPQRVQNYFFGPRSADSVPELKQKVATYKKRPHSSTAATELALRANIRSPEPKPKISSLEPLIININSSQKAEREASQPRSNPLSFWQRLLSTHSTQESPPAPGTYLDTMPMH